MAEREPIALGPGPRLPAEAKTAMDDARSAAFLLPSSTARTWAKIMLHVAEAALVVWLHRGYAQAEEAKR